MIFVGGGYVGFELVMIVNVVGVDVYVIYYNDCLLKVFDVDLVKDLMVVMMVDGIMFDLNMDV